ncbi:hypothetical protein BDF19DRAFT_455317 [Syncephalis fuscata]|nr:hypothetical protein BDF19DRAFT_455317 [Syncephalis fuscata]
MYKHYLHYVLALLFCNLTFFLQIITITPIIAFDNFIDTVSAFLAYLYVILSICCEISLFACLCYESL